MSLKDTLFIGPHNANPVRLPLEHILSHHAVIRDAIAGTGHVLSDDLVSFVANASFVYAFNAYKAIGLLLPHLYHESGAVILRQLWEVSLNLHWVALDPSTRAREFCNLTVMEYREYLRKSGNSEELDDFDRATATFQSRFRYRDARGRARTHSSFATSNIHDRAIELRAPWELEYDLVYHLSSMHAHGAPGAILHGIFQQQLYSHPEVREKDSAALIAILAVNTIVRDVRLLARMNVIPDCTEVNRAFESLQDMMKSSPQVRVDHADNLTDKGSH